MKYQNLKNLQKNQQRRNQSHQRNKFNRLNSTKDLLIFGKSALIELIPLFFNDIKYIVSNRNILDSRSNQIINLAKKFNVEIVLDDSEINKLNISSGENFSICAILKRQIGKTYSYKDISDKFYHLDNVLSVAIPELDYEQNFGAVLRSCVGMGVDFVVIPNDQIDPFSSTVTKTSMGYNYLIPIVRDNFLLTLKNLQKDSFDVIGLDMGGENILNMRYNSRVCFVVGNEAKGLSPAVLSKTTKKVEIPMDNGVESLNVSVSLGIALYDYKYKKSYSNTN